MTAPPFNAPWKWRWKWPWKWPIGLILVIGYLVFGVYWWLLAPTPTPEELAAATERAESKARKAAVENERAKERIAAAKERIATQNDRLDALCKRVSLWEKYGTARQQCAVAGDFNNCVKVKLKLMA